MIRNMNTRLFLLPIAAMIALLAISVSNAAEAQDMKFLLWQKSVAQKIASVQRYPRSAVAKNIEGQAQLRLKILSDGRIEGYEVIKGTGHQVLDREIPKIISKIGSFDAVPGDKPAYTLTLPLTWSLN